ncbi:glycosyltransferase involved in cell wall biosynthesis [Roseimicrobium gellanilyticum]|uniref:Glycosyltransferase involved in cell wall biosynthesis n=1 Tax=Roseimicrobium gellanilyticum TaxID=748857 RepID=A0A366H3E1_9BACT|nr:glycosyltransferase [Roseimicrobium gellanilyticum]RBP36362.1 glycosyltransferase involved in cell wall biosynthesis [Roseimicrobium gellanilyticum]
MTKARGTFFKPLYEALAKAQPNPWRTMLLWPTSEKGEHPEEAVTPRGENIDICMAASTRRRMDTSDAALEGKKGKYDTYLPSREAWRMLKEQDVRAVLIHEFSPFTLQGLIYAKYRRIPVIVSTEVGKRNAHYFHARTRWWHGFWSKLVDGVVACCPAAHESLSGGHGPTFPAYHAVDSRLYTPMERERASNEPVVFAYLGQLIKRKGLDLLLTAAAQLKAGGVGNFKLRFVGGGDESWLRQTIDQHGLGHHCELTGFLTGQAIRNAVGSADVFVLPTRQDTYAAVVHEAACLGLPLLISKHAGAAEALVVDGVNGFTFDPDDAIGTAALLMKLMREEIRAPMRVAARATGESFSAHVRGAELWRWMNRVLPIGVNAEAELELKHEMIRG